MIIVYWMNKRLIAVISWNYSSPCCY